MMHTLLDVVEFITIIIDVIVIPLSLVLALYLLDDFWQRPVPGPTLDGRSFAGEVGLAGPDGGKGGKYSQLNTKE